MFWDDTTSFCSQRLPSTELLPLDNQCSFLPTTCSLSAYTHCGLVYPPMQLGTKCNSHGSCRRYHCHRSPSEYTVHTVGRRACPSAASVHHHPNLPAASRPTIRTFSHRHKHQCYPFWTPAAQPFGPIPPPPITQSTLDSKMLPCHILAT